MCVRNRGAGLHRVRDFEQYYLNSATNLRTEILDFRGFGSSIILVSRGGILMPTGNFLDKGAGPGFGGNVQRSVLPLTDGCAVASLVGCAETALPAKPYGSHTSLAGCGGKRTSCLGMLFFRLSTDLICVAFRNFRKLLISGKATQVFFKTLV